EDSDLGLGGGVEDVVDAHEELAALVPAAGSEVAVTQTDVEAQVGVQVFESARAQTRPGSYAEQLGAQSRPAAMRPRGRNRREPVGPVLHAPGELSADPRSTPQ